MGLCPPLCPQSRCLHRAMSPSTAAMRTHWMWGASATGMSHPPSTTGMGIAAAAAAGVCVSCPPMPQPFTPTAGARVLGAPPPYRWRTGAGGQAPEGPGLETAEVQLLAHGAWVQDVGGVVPNKVGSWTGKPSGKCLLCYMYHLFTSCLLSARCARHCCRSVKKTGRTPVPCWGRRARNRRVQ